MSKLGIYDESSIEHYEGIEAVRKRPTMYLEQLGWRGIYRCVQEIVGNSLDEFNAGRASTIKVHMDENTLVIRIEDDGPGLPLGSIVKCATELHTGGKFNSNAYLNSIGLNGVGLTCVNATSDDMYIRVYREKKCAEISFSKGEITKPLVINDYGDARKHGTLVKFHPDETIFGFMSIDGEFYGDYLDRLACINQGVTIEYSYVPKGKEQAVSRVYKSERGMLGYLEDTMLKNAVTVISQPIEIKRIDDTVTVPFGSTIRTSEIGIQAFFTWVKSSRGSRTYSFVNGIETAQGGTHVNSFRDGVAKILRRDLREFVNKKEPYYDKFQQADLFEGFVGVIQAYHSDPIFDGQTKNNFTSTDCADLCAKVAAERFEEWTKLHPKQYKELLAEITLAAKARYASNKARDSIKGIVKSSNNSTLSKIKRFVDCMSNKPEEREMFIVEGDSAGGSASSGRNAKTQAIYKLMGKPLNSYSVKDLKVIFKDTAINALRDLVNVLRMGFGSSMDISKLAFHKIIIMADADPDGSHIVALLLGFFYSFMPELIERGHIYIANPPLFRMQFKGNKKIYVANMNAYWNIIEKTILKRFDVCLYTIWNNQLVMRECNPKFSRGFLRAIRNYKEIIETTGLQMNINPALLEAVVLNYEIINEQDRIRVHGWDLEVYFDPELHCKVIEGVYENKFHKIELNHYFIQSIERLVEEIKKIKWSNIILKDKETGKQLGPSLYKIAYGINFLIQKSVDISRFKGLGEMNPPELWETTMNPKTRVLTKVTMNDSSRDKYVQTLDTFIGRDIEAKKAFFREFLSYTNN